MATATAAQSSPSAGCVTLRGIGWECYERLVEEMEEQRFRHAYRDGELTIRASSIPHEWNKSLIGQMIEALTEELKIARHSVGSLTMRELSERVGAEADEAYSIANEARMRAKPQFDPATDPPPDLLVEVDIFSPFWRRLEIYAALGVPEVWVYDGRSLRAHLLEKDGTYRESETSGAFPFLEIARLTVWLDKSRETDETTWIRAFRQWVREGWGSAES